MSNPRSHFVSIVGEAEASSQLMSNDWELRQGQDKLAVMRRFPRRHISVVKLGDGSSWELRPAGWGVVEAVDGDEVFAAIHRRSWWGRRWAITSAGFAVDLVSRPTPRRWSFTIGDHAIGELSGSAVSYNRIHIQADVAVPLAAVLLAWQVIARPWEAAALPTQVVPSRRWTLEGSPQPVDPA
ncbi:MAG: hypothetical protein OEM22_03695 [Acidimicrobiia bacterium]|nr:hypothetical protein [Acidimicrobiia bacterium]MDH3471222.1 hypothetical protein [Acidimicrobiia bacterium]